MESKECVLTTDGLWESQETKQVSAIHFAMTFSSPIPCIPVELLDWQHYFWEHQESVPCYQKSRVGKTSKAYDHLSRPVYDEMNLLKPWCTRTASEFIHYVLAKFTQMFGHCSTPVATSQNPVE
ncbi:hypothetical protein OIU77_031168 [Salix suchowensis]|uniref:Uncharacterized protein n=1 Tax=Salix suchowensis TaxID=1278906 RepID=A0ABQ9BI47_9ROSI|nr:hypothetical protein OIU77_031168 [Salix suchowensis]